MEKEGKWRGKEKNCKREGGKLKMEVGINLKMSRGPFFFFFNYLFIFFCFSLLKMTKICFGLLIWKFSTRKKHFTPGKNQEKLLYPLKKIFLLRPCIMIWVRKSDAKLWHNPMLTMLPSCENIERDCSKRVKNCQKVRVAGRDLGRLGEIHRKIRLREAEKRDQESYKAFNLVTHSIKPQMQ